MEKFVGKLNGKVVESAENYIAYNHRDGTFIMYDQALSAVDCARVEHRKSPEENWRAYQLVGKTWCPIPD